MIRFSDHRLRRFAQPRDRGGGPARNRGAAEASADRIVSRDSADELVPEALAIILERAAKSDPDVACAVFSMPL